MRRVELLRCGAAVRRSHHALLAPISPACATSVGGRYNYRPHVVLTLTHRYNAVSGHRTGSNNSGAEDYLRGKNKIKQKMTHTITETNRIPQT